MNKNQESREEWISGKRFLILLAVVVFGLFARTTLGLHTFFFRDFGALGYPYAAYLKDSLLQGELPFWNPYSHCGVPFLAQMGNWYPPTLLSLLLPIPWAVNFFMLTHLVWGGLGVFWLLRRWGVGAFPASVAGFAFAFNGVTFSCLIWGNYIASLAWMPWLVGSVMAAWKNGGRWIPVAAVVSALQVLTATPEITLLSWLLLGVLWTAAVLSREVKFLPALGRLAALVALAAGMTMVQMLPFFDLLTHSQRETASAESSHWAMPGWGWANLFVPLFHTYRAPQGQWFQPGQEFLVSYYLGAGAMALAILGLLVKRSRIMAVIAGMTLFCWILALGANGYLYDWIKRVFPLISIARFPVKFTILTAFLLPLLAAWGVEQLRNRTEKPVRALAPVLGGLLGLFGLLLTFAYLYPLRGDNWRAMALNSSVRLGLMLIIVGGVWLQSRLQEFRARVAVQLLVLAMFPLDALTHNSNLTPTLPASNLAPGMWEASGKPAPPKPGEGRIMISAGAEQLLNYSHIKDFAMDFTGKRLAEWYNLNLIDRIPKVAGAITLRPAHFDIIERQLYYTPGVHIGEPLLDFLAAAWISAPNNPLDWTRRTNALPVITAGQRPVFAAASETLKAIKADDFAPRQIVYLPEAGRSIVTVSNQAECVVRDIKFGQNRVTFETEAARPSMVVLSQTYYHLWDAYVDGEITTLYRANLAFQALEVPAGTHRVELVYRDRYFVAGGAISIASLAMCGLVWFRCREVGAGKVPSPKLQ